MSRDGETPAQAELARTSRAAAVGTVSAAIAHEINQPLGAVVLNAQTCLRYLRRATPDIESAIAAAERVVRESTRASLIVRETRALIAKEGSQGEPTRLDRLIKEAVELLEREIAAIGAEVTLQLPAEPVWLSGHAVALQQVLINLLSNALAAVATLAREQRRVNVSLITDEQQIILCVRDCGPGVAVEHLERIFEPFFTTKDGGVGLGLAISRAAIEAHGGTLRARNDAAGGAVFECRIPRRATVADEM